MSEELSRAAREHLGRVAESEFMETVSLSPEEIEIQVRNAKLAENAGAIAEVQLQIQGYADLLDKYQGDDESKARIQERMDQAFIRMSELQHPTSSETLQ